METEDEWLHLFFCIPRALGHFITVNRAAQQRAREQLQNLNSLVCKPFVLLINIHKQISVAVHFTDIFMQYQWLFFAAASLLRLLQRYHIKHRITGVVNTLWLAHHLAPRGDLLATQLPKRRRCSQDTSPASLLFLMALSKHNVRENIRIYVIKKNVSVFCVDWNEKGLIV